MHQRRLPVDTHLEAPVNGFLRPKKSVRLTLGGLPGTAQVDETGAVEGAPKPDPGAQEYALKHLGRPVLDLLRKFPETVDLPTPSVRIDFGSAPAKAAAGEHPRKSADAEDKDGAADSRFPIEQPRWSLDAVLVPASTRAQLTAAMTFVRKHELIFDKWNLRSIVRSSSAALALNFHGPSGTGKSLCAEAVAAELGLGLLRVNYAEMESKFVGEMNKNIRLVFARAGEHRCVLFFDEADSVLGKRLSQVTQAADHGVNMARSVLLTELDHYQGVVVFATNLAQNYDHAFARRIRHSIHFALPDLEARARLFRAHLPAQLPVAAEASADRLAEAADGFSGGDICNVVLLAAADAAASGQPAAKVTLQHFLAAVEQVRATRAAITGQPGQDRSAADRWMDSKLQTALDRNPPQSNREEAAEMAPPGKGM